jgi:predicted dehydrogenase
MGKEALSVLVVGAGFMGKKHVESYLALGSAVLAAVVDQNKKAGEMLARSGNCPWYPSLETALETVRPDIVDVCLPSNMHKEPVTSALQYGCDVIVEKPFAVNLADIDAMIAARNDSGRRLMVAHTCRFMPQYIYAKSVVESRIFGKLLNAHLFRLSELPRWSWNNWLQDKEASGGTIMDLSIHDIDLANWFLGTPGACKAHETSSAARPGASHIVSMLSYPSKGFAVVEASHLMAAGYPFTSGYRLVFEQAVVEWNTVNCKTGCIFEYDGTKRRDIPAAEVPAIIREDPYEAELASFMACLQNGSPFPISVEEARLAVHTVWELKKNIEEMAL